MNRTSNKRATLRKPKRRNSKPTLDEVYAWFKKRANAHNKRMDAWDRKVEAQKKKRKSQASKKAYGLSKRPHTIATLPHAQRTLLARSAAVYKHQMEQIRKIRTILNGIASKKELGI